MTTTSTTKAYVWLTPWMPAMGVDTVTAVRKNHAVDGSIETFLAVQTAAVRTDSPSAPAVIGAALNGDGEVCSTNVSVSQYTASVYYVRFGVAYALPSGGSGLGQADVAFSLSYTQRGQVIDSRSLSLDTSTSGDATVLISGWVPALMAQKMKATVVCRSASGSFEWKLVYRTASTSKTNPSGWNTLEASWRGATEMCSGELTVNDDNDMYVQFGLLYHSTSGSAQATVDTSVAVRRNG